MKEIKYTLPKRAQQIHEEAMKQELQASSDYTYLSMCFGNIGAFHSAKWAMSQAEEERCHFKKHVEYLQSRGIESDVPATKQPEIKFTDCASGIAYAYEMEIALTKKYGEWYRECIDVDELSMLKIMDFLQTQQYSLARMNDIYAVVKAISDPNEQREALEMYFGPKDVING